MIEIIHYFISTRLYYLIFYRFFKIPIRHLQLRANINCSYIKILLFRLRTSSIFKIIRQWLLQYTSTIPNNIESLFPLIRRKWIKI
jgi:hypothetical protein